MSLPSHQALLRILERLLLPVARFCLRRSLAIQDLVECCKRVYIAVATEEITRTGAKVNVSRLAAITGMHRRDVMRLSRGEEIKDEPLGLIARVIGQWQKDPRFGGKNGKPRALTYGAGGNEFGELVQTISHDLHPGTILFELERLGAIERTSQGVRLIADAYVPRGDMLQSYELMARDCNDLMRAVEDNLAAARAAKNLHASTEFDNIPVEEEATIRAWLVQEGSKFHAKVRAYLARYDRDLNPTLKGGKGRLRAVIGTYSLCEEARPERSNITTSRKRIVGGR